MILEKGLIKVKKVAHSRLQELDKNNLTFGKHFADHMFVCDFKDGAWQDARIVPFENISMSPATSFIHYGQSIFEGMKAHRNNDGRIYVFRPDMNIKRLNKSAERMCMPTIPEELFREGLLQLLSLDKDWVPDGEDSSMYIRPFMFGTDDYLGVKPSETYRFMIINSPSGSYYKKPVRVKIETHFTRAAKGGIGEAKAAGNYGASLYPFKLAQKEGFDQLVWTDAKEHKYIEESGTMNIMFVIGDKLITPALSKTILPGITRDSALTLARHWGWQVEERPVAVAELLEAHKNGTFHEAFGIGTAATIAQIQAINFEGTEIELKPISERIYSNKLSSYLNKYKRAYVEDEFNWLVEIN